MTRAWLRLAWLVPWVGLLLLPACASSAPDPVPRRPNVVLFLVDDMGWQETSVPFHTGPTPLNRRYVTPNMERLAATGVKFTQACASAVCSPSRTSLMTGMNAARHRVTNWTLRRDRSPDNQHPTLTPPEWNLNGICAEAGVARTIQVTALPALLRKNGYRTLHVGKAHFGAQDTPGADPRNLGFDVNIAGHAAGGPGSYHGEKNFSAAWRNEDRIWDVPGLEAYHGTDTNLTEALTQEAVRAMTAAVADGAPFFLHLSHYAIHAPWEPDARFHAKYVAAGLPPFEATLASMIEGMDHSLGLVLAALDRLGVASNTIVLFVSDNGSPSQCPPNLPLRGHKLSPYEGGARVPMLARWPGVTPPGSRCDEPVVIEDLFPTILEATHTPWRGMTVQTVDGESCLPLLAGEAPTGKDPRSFVWHFPHQYGGQGPFSALRCGQWKLVYHHTGARFELFDLQTDLSESTDLAASEPERLRMLAVQLGSLLRERAALMPIQKADGMPVPWPDDSLAAVAR